VAGWSGNRQQYGFLIWFLITLGINVLALLVINWLFDSIGIEGFWSYALGALTLTIANAVLKPILAILTLPLIVLTLGIAYFAINVLMLALAEWVAPHFSIDGFWTYVGATIVVWIVNIAMQGLLALMTGGDGPASTPQEV
jgi:putative membrane protein